MHFKEKVLTQERSLSFPPKLPRMQPRKHRRLTKAEKLRIIQDADKGVTQTLLAERLGISQQAVSKILQPESRKRLRESTLPDEARRVCSIPHADIERKVLDWIAQVRTKYNEDEVPITREMLMAQAEKIATRLGKKDWQVSRGWLERFQRAHEITYARLTGEAGSVNAEEYEAGRREIMAQLDGAKTENIFNMDETGLFWRLLPSRSMISAEEIVKEVRGGKVAKDRVTLAICTNWKGNIKLPIMMVGKSQQPLSWQRQTHVHYPNQGSAWMDSKVFSHWLECIFTAEVEKIIQNEDYYLLLDNCSAHKIPEGFATRHPHCKISFLRPNLTSKLQPNDQGLIAWVKAKYKRKLSLNYLDVLNDREGAEARKKAAKRGLRGWRCGGRATIGEAGEILNEVWPGMAAQHIRNWWSRAVFREEDGIARMDALPPERKEDAKPETAAIAELVEAVQGLSLGEGGKTKEAIEAWVTIDSNDTVLAASLIFDLDAIDVEEDEEEELGEEEEKELEKEMREDIRNVKGLLTSIEIRSRALGEMALHSLVVGMIRNLKCYSAAAASQQTRLSSFFHDA